MLVFCVLVATQTVLIVSRDVGFERLVWIVARGAGEARVAVAPALAAFEAIRLALRV